MDAEKRANLLNVIESLYAAALSADHHDAFQDQWSAYLADLPARPDGLADPVLQHVEKALTIIDRLQFANAGSLDPQSLVDQEPTPTGIIDGSGTLLARNAALKTVLPRQAHSIWDLISDSKDQAELRSALRSVHQIADARTQFLSFQMHAEDGLTLASVRRLPTQGTSEKETARFKFQIGHPVWSPAASDFLTETFSITPAERAVLQGMVKGDSFQKIAEGADRSADTIKAQSKSIYRKLGVSGREAAVRLILQLHLIMGPKPARTVIADSENILELTSGRKIGYWVRGDMQGKPFLFLHGMSLGHNMTAEFVQGLKKLGLKAICVDRPGYRTSDPPRDWRHSVEEWANLFPELMDRLGLDRTSIVTHTTGVMYACAAAAMHPARVSGICALAGGVPITEARMLEEYPSQLRLIARTARFSPTALRFLVTSGTAFFYRKNGAEKTIRRTYSQSPADKAALDHPDIYALVEQGMTLIGQQGRGYDGFVGDGLKVFGDWSDYPAKLQCSLTYVIGDEDPICPLDWARAFAQKHPHITVEAIAGAGQLLHHTHPDITLQHIARLCQKAR